jgi:hypothetical protein
MLWLVRKYKSKAPQLKQSQTDSKHNNPLLDYILSTSADHPPFCLQILFNKISLFFISSLFSYFNLFVSIFIQAHVNNNLHVSTLYTDYFFLSLYYSKKPQGRNLKWNVLHHVYMSIRGRIPTCELIGWLF